MRRIVLTMSAKAVRDLGLREGETFAHAGHAGRVVALTAAGDGFRVKVDVEDRVALTGVPGEPPPEEGENA